MSNGEFDYSAFKKEPSDNILAELAEMASKQKEAERNVADLQDKLKAAQEELRNISEHQLPALMDEAEVEEFTTKDGVKISVKEAIRGSIPAGSAGQAFRWLEEHGHEKLIKREFTVMFNRDEEEWAKEFEETLKQDERQLNFKLKRSVVPQTLQAFVREQLAQGVDFPLAMFGVFRQRVAKITVKDKD